MEKSSEWFEEGLRFSCTQCGNCCVGDPGAVWLNEEEERAIARKLKRGLRSFRSEFTTTIEGKRSLTEVNSERGQHCVFLGPGSKGCTIYPVRPKQCRTWPFWKENLDELRWKGDLRAVCPGLDKGRRYTKLEIEQRALHTERAIEGEDAELS